jgi:hypothetical protein
MARARRPAGGSAFIPCNQHSKIGAPPPVRIDQVGSDVRDRRAGRLLPGASERSAFDPLQTSAILTKMLFQSEASMRTLFAILVSTSLFAIAAVAAAATPEGPSSAIALSALQAICLGGDTTPAAVLARADAAGWTKTRPSGVTSWDVGRDRAEQVGTSILYVDTWAIDNAAAHEDSCTIGANAPTQGWRIAAQQWLGLSPSAALGPTATFFTVRTDSGWRAAIAADRENATTAAGKHFNFVAVDGIWRGEDRPPAMLMVDHFRPAAPAK